MLLTHPWNLTPDEAITLQKELRQQIDLSPMTKPVSYIAGADISFNKYSDVVYAGFVLLELKSLEVIAHSVVVGTATFPYVPGLLSFREIPSLLQAWEQLPWRPDVVMLDGQGIAHPRRLGIATHFGLYTGWPTFGCAKSLLTGKYTPPALEAGSTSDLLDKAEKIGTVVRTKNKVNPVFVSAGNLISQEQSVALTLQCVTKYRIPEPTRQAHLLVNQLRRGEIEAGYWEKT